MKNMMQSLDNTNFSFKYIFLWRLSEIQKLYPKKTAYSIDTSDRIIKEMAIF